MSRSILVHATPSEIWLYAVSNHSINAEEGRWTITHNIIGIPRPRGTVMKGTGVGAVRTAYWGHDINFEEQITEWTPGQALGWKFGFSNTSLQDYTDEHISPDGQFLKIDSGGYMIHQISSETSLLKQFAGSVHARQKNNRECLGSDHVSLFVAEHGLQKPMPFTAIRNYGFSLNSRRSPRPAQ